GAIVSSFETFLNLSILILAPFALGHVTDSAGDQYPFLGLQRAQADLHRKLTPVLPPPVKFQPRPHGSRARISKIARAVPGMRSSKPLGHQNLNRLPEQLLTGVAEQLLRLRIHQQDAALPAHDHHRVRRRLQQTPKLRLRPLPRGDVPDGAGDQYPFLGLQRAQADLHRKLAPILPPPVEFQPAPPASRPRIIKLALPLPRMR